MNHLGTKAMETERLWLRRFTAEDADKMYQNWANDNDVTKFLTWPTHNSVDVSKAILAEWISLYEKDDYYQWAIVPKKINEPIGSISVVFKRDDLKLAHIGYCIGKNWWKQGITSEALAAVIKFLFEEVGMNRIEARHDPNNPNSGSVMVKCSMKYEGTMRQADVNNQGLSDFSLYAILAEDYFSDKIS